MDSISLLRSLKGFGFTAFSRLGLCDFRVCDFFEIQAVLQNFFAITNREDFLKEAERFTDEQCEDAAVAALNTALETSTIALDTNMVYALKDVPEKASYKVKMLAIFFDLFTSLLLDNRINLDYLADGGNVDEVAELWITKIMFPASSSELKTEVIAKFPEFSTWRANLSDGVNMANILLRIREGKQFTILGEHIIYDFLDSVKESEKPIRIILEAVPVPMTRENVVKTALHTMKLFHL